MDQFASRRYSPSALAPLSRDRPDLFVPAAMSLIELPPSSDSQRYLCNYLISMPAFLAFIGHPDQFSRDELARVLRSLMQIDPLVDAKLAATLRTWRRDDAKVDKAVILRILDVLDEISPGRRLVMTLSPLVRDDEQPVASKAALIMGRRVENASWVEGQLASPDARVRANVIESLWGLQTLQAKKWMHAALEDSHNRVVGNALVGLFLAGDPEAVPRLREMLRHPDPMFRASAAWAMGRTGCEDFAADLEQARQDSEEGVRRNAELALSKVTAATQAPARQAGGEPAAPQPVPANAAQKPDKDKAPEVDVRLDGRLRVRPFSYLPGRTIRRAGL